MLNVEIISTEVEYVALVISFHIILLREGLQESLSLAEEALKDRRLVPEGLLMQGLLRKAAAVLSH